MESIIPVGIIIYILASIIGAVLKSLAQGPATKDPNAQPDQASPARRFQPVQGPVIVTDPTGHGTQILFDEEDQGEEALEQESKQQEEPEESHHYLTVEELDEQDFAEWEDDLFALGDDGDKKTAVSPIVSGLDRKKMVEAIILSEVLNKPRSMRPWPNR